MNKVAIYKQEIYKVASTAFMRALKDAALKGDEKRFGKLSEDFLRMKNTSANDSMMKLIGKGFRGLKGDPESAGEYRKLMRRPHSASESIEAIRARDPMGRKRSDPLSYRRKLDKLLEENKARRAKESVNVKNNLQSFKDNFGK